MLLLKLFQFLGLLHLLVRRKKYINKNIRFKFLKLICFRIVSSPKNTQALIKLYSKSALTLKINVETH